MGKNACMLLNEKCRDVVFKVSRVGPIHMPMFTIEATINGQTFIGSGRTKKQAKLAAAERVVQALNLSAETVNTNKEINDGLAATSDVGSNIKTQRLTTGAGNAATVERVLSNDDSNPMIVGKHPVLMLNELRPRAEYVAFDEESELQRCKVTVDGQTFEGTGVTKKLAKAKAAETALTSLFHLTFSYLKDGQPVYQGDDSQWTRYKLKVPAYSADTANGKNPVQMLNELFHEPHYEFVDGTRFSVVLKLRGRTYRGEGATKKLAKTNCALAAVKELMANGVIKSRIAEKEAKKRRMNKYVQGTNSPSLLDSAVIKLAVHFPDLQYRLVSHSDLWNSGQIMYSVAVTVRGEDFVANGPTEKAAKDNVASKVLTKFALWSADDKQMKEAAARAEIEATNSPFMRGGRRPGTDRAVMTSGYSVCTVIGQQGSEQTGGSSGWHGSNTPGVASVPAGLMESGISFGRGASIANAFPQGPGLFASKDVVSNRGRGSFRGIASRGPLGRGNRAQSGAGIRSGGLGSRANNFGYSEQLVEYRTESGAIYGQSDNNLSQELSEGVYHANAINTIGNRGARVLLHRKSNESCFPGNSVNNVQGFSNQRHSNQIGEVLDSDRRGKAKTWNKSGSGEIRASESSWCYETPDGNYTTSSLGYPGTASVYVLNNEAPFVGNYGAAMAPAQVDEYFGGTYAQTGYFQQDDYFVGNAGNSYGYESVGAQSGMHGADLGFAYTQYGAYGAKTEQ